MPKNYMDIKYSDIIEHADEKRDNGKTIGDILSTFNDEQMSVLQFLLYKSFTLSEEERKKLLSEK